MKKTNFDRYLEELSKTPGFAERAERADRCWDIAFQVYDLRGKAGLSQTALARKAKCTKLQICQLESGGWGHSMRMLERVAKALNARVRVVLEPLKPAKA
jgi:DNA-binding XRE family transcriptional regulator